MQEDFLSSLLLKSFRRWPRKGAFFGASLFEPHTKFPDPKYAVGEPVEFDAIVVGYYHPRVPDAFHIDAKLSIWFNPKWGYDWPSSVDLPRTHGILPEKLHLSHTERGIKDQADQLKRFFDVEGMQDVHDKLLSVAEEIRVFNQNAIDDNIFYNVAPAPGQYVLMRLAPDVQDDERLFVIDLPILIKYYLRTCKRLYDIGRKDLIFSFNLKSFVGLHEEMALTGKYNDGFSYTCLAAVMRKQSKKIGKKIIHMKKMLRDEVIEMYGGFENALSVEFRSCKEFSQNADELIALDPEEYPEVIRLSIDFLGTEAGRPVADGISGDEDKGNDWPDWNPRHPRIY